ncbi:MAG TPA: hypothetical protein VH333_19465 [Pseudonocardiaceae bacterium]|nr:hypothetical protein [Pseudonocardiaceae bacterium]
MLTDPANGDPCAAVSSLTPDHRNVREIAPPSYCASIEGHGTVVTIADDVRVPALLAQWYGQDSAPTGGPYVWVASTTASVSYTAVPAVLLALLLAALVGLATHWFAGGPRPRQATGPTGDPLIPPVQRTTQAHWPAAPSVPAATAPVPARTSVAGAHRHAVARTFVGKHGGYVAVGGLLRWAEQAPDDDRVAEPGDAVLVVGNGRGPDELRVRVVPRDRAERTFI